MKRKRSINIPLNWSLTQILYSYDGVSKSDIVAEAIRQNKGRLVQPDYISKKLREEYPDRSMKQFLQPELTASGRRALLHVNVPPDLYDAMIAASVEARLSISKTVACMLNRLYDTNREVTPLPKCKTNTVETVRIAINFPITMVKQVEKLTNDKFRDFVLEAVEEYIGFISEDNDDRGSLNGGFNSTRGMGE